MMKCFLNYQLGNSRNKLFLKKEIGPEQMEQMINYLLYMYLPFVLSIISGISCYMESGKGSFKNFVHKKW